MTVHVHRDDRAGVLAQVAFDDRAAQIAIFFDIGQHRCGADRQHALDDRNKCM